VVDERPRPPGRKHSSSIKAITARQLQAPVRQHASLNQMHFTPTVWTWAVEGATAARETASLGRYPYTAL